MTCRKMICPKDSTNRTMTFSFLIISCVHVLELRTRILYNMQLSNLILIVALIFRIDFFTEMFMKCFCYPNLDLTILIVFPEMILASSRILIYLSRNTIFCTCHYRNIFPIFQCVFCS